jgi:integrase/recombinase XerC
MLNHGADINAIKDLLGHTSLSATEVYTHNTVEKIKSVYKQAHPKA